MRKPEDIAYDKGRLDVIRRMRKEIARLKPRTEDHDRANYTNAYLTGTRHALRALSDFLDILEDEIPRP